jgi:hypothetical protein
MPVTIDELRKANRLALETVTQSLKVLRQRRIGASPSVLDRINAQISECRSEITRLSIIDEHLKAASTVVKPMSGDDEKELQRLADILDQTIHLDTILNATLEGIIELVDNAQELGDRIREAT